jgi:hypothetical protein
MAKKNGNLRYYIGTIVVVVFATIGFVYNRGVQARAIQDTEKHVVTLEKTTSMDLATLKKEGCDPADEAGDDILVIKTEMKYIKGGIDDIKLEQKAMQETAVERQEAVLEAIHAIREK